MADPTFVFPADRFPTFEPASPWPEEDYGCSLHFGLRSEEYAAVPMNLAHHSFTPTRQEIERKTMEVTYSAAEDRYSRPGSGLKLGINGWNGEVWRSVNVSRKLEEDWNMAYLARTNSNNGRLGGLIEWRFNLAPARQKVKELKVRFPYMEYRDGKVRISVCSKDDYTTLLNPHRLTTVVRAKGWDDFIIRAELSGEEGIAYQNAQIFRQPVKNENDTSPNDLATPFRVIIEME